MSRKEQAEIENDVGAVVGTQNKTSGKAGNRQEMTGKEKQIVEAINVINVIKRTGKTIN